MGALVVQTAPDHLVPTCIPDFVDQGSHAATGEVVDRQLHASCSLYPLDGPDDGTSVAADWYRGYVGE